MLSYFPVQLGYEPSYEHSILHKFTPETCFLNIMNIDVGVSTVF